MKAVVEQLNFVNGLDCIVQMLHHQIYDIVKPMQVVVVIDVVSVSLDLVQLMLHNFVHNFVDMVKQ